MKIITIGNGFIASHLPYEIAKYRFTPNLESVFDLLGIYKPDVIINAVGFCGTPNVDQCEIEQEKSNTSNTVIPIMLANECKQRNIHMIHMGSGCINYGPSPHSIPYEFTGDNRVRVDTGWKETDFSSPLSYYSKSKYATDLTIGSMSNVCVLRLRMPISSTNSPRNLLNKLIKYDRVLEEPNSMTFVSDLVRAIDWAVENRKTGIYNIASPKPLTHSVLLEEFKKHFPGHKYERITKEQLEGLVAAPRSNCILDVSKSISEGFVYGDVDTLVRDTVKEFASNIQGKI